MQCPYGGIEKHEGIVSVSRGKADFSVRGTKFERSTAESDLLKMIATSTMPAFDKTPAQEPSQEELARLQKRFDKLEVRVDAFSIALERLAKSRKYNMDKKDTLDSSRIPSWSLSHQGQRSDRDRCVGGTRCVDHVGSRAVDYEGRERMFVAIILVAGAVGTAMLQWHRQRKVECTDWILF